ncbi:MAG: hypothetical protein JO061_21775 [Acidobacteriaceae bacterium]|nr:hypothetical protein [Acidobacteriaceae bacterium]
MNFVCVTCGAQFAESNSPPSRCAICEDERQYVGLDGQQWTTLDELRQQHLVQFTDEEPGIFSMHIEPKFGIGQRCLLIATAAGNILWDCISLFDSEVIRRIRSAGGLSAICISHPHYYTTMVEWSREFGDVPVYLHADDQRWVMRQDKAVEPWTGETKQLPSGVTIIRCGGHFAGASVLHYAEGAGGRGALFSGDTIQVCPDLRSVSFMYSYPNYIPLSQAAVTRILAAVEPYRFDRIYGAFSKMTIASGAREVVRNSAERYLRFLTAAH